MKIVDYFNKLINDYYITDNILEKQSLLKFINAFYDNINEYDFHNKNTYRELSKIYRSFKLDINFKTNSGNESESIKNYIDNANEDLLYLRDLVKHIKLKKKRIKSLDNIGTLEDLNNYIKTNQSFYDFYKNINYEVILDSNFISGYTLKYKDKYLFVFENLNIALILHELMHIYNKFSFSKYYETPSIVAEMAITKEFNIKDDLRRKDDVKDLKKLRKITNKSEYYTYSYGVGSIIAITFVNMYGTNFNDVIRMSDYLIENETIPLNKVFNFMNVKESEVIDSVNNIEKILKYKK